MAKRLYRINSPEFSEYVYNLMSKIPAVIKQTLNRGELLLFKNSKTMYRFANLESLDRRLQLLAKMRIPFAIVLGEPDYIHGTLSNIEKKLRPKDKVELVEYMAHNNVFAFSTAQVIESLNLAAQNSHSRLYCLNAQYVKLNQKIADAGIASKVQNYRDASAALEMMSVAIIETLNNFDTWGSVVDLDPDEMKILIALYKYRNALIPYEKVLELVDESSRGRVVPRSLNNLEKQRYIKVTTEKSVGNKSTKFYVLSDLGIETALKFIKLIANKACYS